MKLPTCRTCRWVVPTGKGRRANEEVDIGECHGDTPRITTEGAGAYPPVTLDMPGCRHHESSTAAKAAQARKKP